MNTEYRNKLYNRIKDVFEKEDTQERQGFLEARENFEDKQTTAFELARQVVERSYPTDDVATLRKFKKKYGDPCDVVAKDKCFYFAYTDKDDEGEDKETKSHFDFSLYGNLNGNEYGGGEENDHFAHAYYREELKEKGLNPDIIAQQSGKDNNPHKTKHIDANNKFLGKSSNGNTMGYENGIGLTKKLIVNLNLMSLELLIVDQEQSLVPKPSTNSLNNGVWQKPMLFPNTKLGLIVSANKPNN